MISERCTGYQTERRSGLSSLERAQGLRDLRAREWATLGDHGGGGMVFRGEDEGRFGLRERRAN
jgi:hypothetical protein